MGIQNGFEKFFVFLRFNIISDDVYNFCQKIQVWKLVWILYGSGLKTGVENNIFLVKYNK